MIDETIEELTNSWIANFLIILWIFYEVLIELINIGLPKNPYIWFQINSHERKNFKTFLIEHRWLNNFLFYDKKNKKFSINLNNLINSKNVTIMRFDHNYSRKIFIDVEGKFYIDDPLIDFYNRENSKSEDLIIEIINNLDLCELNDYGLLIRKYYKKLIFKLIDNSINEPFIRAYFRFLLLDMFTLPEIINSRYLEFCENYIVSKIIVDNEPIKKIEHCLDNLTIENKIKLIVYDTCKNPKLLKNVVRDYENFSYSQKEVISDLIMRWTYIIDSVDIEIISDINKIVPGTRKKLMNKCVIRI